MHARRPRAAPRPARCGHACVEPQHHGIERSQDVVHGTADSKPMLGMSESLVSSFSEELQRVFVAAIEQLQAELKSAKCVTLESELLRVKNVAAASQQEMVVKWRHIVNDTFRRADAHGHGEGCEHSEEEEHSCCHVPHDDVTVDNAVRSIFDADVKLSKIRDGSYPYRELQLSRLELGDEGARQLAMHLPQASQLESLQLSENGIADRGAEALADAVARLPALRSLGLAENQIGPDGAARLARSVHGMANLEVLDLDSNRIGDAGAIELFDSLVGRPDGQMVRELWLGSNELSDASAASILPRLADASRRGLCSLWLNDNLLSDSSLPSLEAALPEAEGLVELGLSDNDLSDQAMRSLTVLKPPKLALM